MNKETIPALFAGKGLPTTRLNINIHKEAKGLWTGVFAAVGKVLKTAAKNQAAHVSETRKVSETTLEIPYPGKAVQVKVAWYSVEFFGSRGITVQLIAPGVIIVLRNGDRGFETLDSFINRRHSLAK